MRLFRFVNALTVGLLIVIIGGFIGCIEEETEAIHIPIVDIGDMILIPEGEFEMGDHHGDGWEYELPVHTVYLDAFYIDKYEVTNAQYALFLNEYGRDTDAEEHSLLEIDNPWCQIENVGGIYKPKTGQEDHPVVEVSWYGAAAYAQFYGERLPHRSPMGKGRSRGIGGEEIPLG